MFSSCSITRNAFFYLENKWDESPKLRPLVLLAAAVAAVASPLLLLADGARWAYRSWIKKIPSTDYHYFYSTEIFSRYLEQLKEYIGNELKDHPGLQSLDLVKWVQGAVSNRETFHQGFVSQVRNLVNQKETLDPEISQFVQRFCAWIYTGATLLPAMTEWIKGHMTEEEKERLAGGKTHEFIRDLHTQWGCKAQFQGETFQDYRPYDPRILGDTPSSFFKVHDTQIIRTPAVTADNKRSFFGTLTKASIVEEFRGFLQHYQQEKKTHLYINLMAPTGSEKVRTNALEDLEKENKIVFQLVTLSKDSSFYHQTDPFARKDNAEFFKKDFIEQMFGNSPHFHWPISWDLPETKEFCRQAVETIHEKYFNSSNVLKIEQRRDFIELAYTEIIETLLVHKKPASCNISCRSCVDRGAANLSLLYAKTPSTKEAKEETLVTIALAPAIIAQSRLMLTHRMKRLHTALGRL